MQNRALWFLWFAGVLATATSHGHRGWVSDLAERNRRNNDLNTTVDRKYLSCSEPDVLFVIESSAKELMKKFDGAMKDVQLIARLMVAANEKGGDADPMLRLGMCCCVTADWQDLDRTSPWAGYHNCDAGRKNELYFGNQSMNGGYGVFTGTRTIDTDLAWLSPASTIFPWIIDRQTKSFDRDGFYVAAWMGTSGEVWTYYPGFNQIWPDHYFGDFVGGEYNGRDDIFVKPTLPTNNPRRKPLWTQPYVDPAGAGNMISAISPIYFNGPFRGHTFSDDFIASTGVDILLIYMENLVSSVKPTPTSLPMVIDDEGHLVSAPTEAVEAIFGKGVTLEDTISCVGDESDAISQQRLSCKIMGSTTADWAGLMKKILVEPRGRRRLLEDEVIIGGVRHLGAVFRWEGEDTPTWNSLVLVPVQELEDAFRWEVPSELQAKITDPKGTAELKMTLSNTGSVDLVYRLKWLPVFVSVKATDPPAPNNEHLSVEIALPAHSSVQYTLLLSAAKTSGRGTHSQTLAWELHDDDYPDCIVQNEVSVAITLVVDPPSQEWVILVAAIVSSLLALAIAAFVYISWKHRQADAVWSIKLSDLHFKTEPPEVLGRGTYGLVVAAEYRKTAVAVKRVIPPASSSKEYQKMTSLFGHGVTKPGQGLLLDQLFTHPTDEPPSSPISDLVAPPAALGNSQKAYQAHLSTTSGRGMMLKSQRHGVATLWQKFCTCWLSEHGRMRKDFIQEMRHVSKMRHPCITTMMGAVIEGGKCEPMLVMELMEHGSLYDLTHNRTVEFSGELVIPILRHVAQGLTFLHHHPIVHGDVKAANVLVDSQFRGKVTDFGLTAKQYTASGPCGTPFWMAPELLRGGVNTPQSDVYALGVTIFEVYARKEPYADLDARQVLQEVADPSAAVSTTGRTARRPRIPEDCPQEVQYIMKECWHSDPTCRPSCEEIDRMLKTLDTQTMGPARSNFFGRTSSSAADAMLGIKRGASESVRNLLHEVFPKRIAEKLLAGQKVQPEHKEEVTIFFSDIVGFTDISSALSSLEVSEMLDRLYIQFDELSRHHGIFKVETIGDAYMAVTNLEDHQDRDHVVRIAAFATDAIEAAAATLIDPNKPHLGSINIRVGFHVGPVVSNVVGTRNPRFCLFGDTVNTASRMESNSTQGRIHCSERAANTLKKQLYDSVNASQRNSFDIEPRGEILVKGKGMMNTFWVSKNGPAGGLPAAPMSNGIIYAPPSNPQPVGAENPITISASRLASAEDTGKTGRVSSASRSPNRVQFN